MTASVWNPADLSGVSISANGLRVDYATAKGGVRATQGQTSGKYYFEITPVAWSGSDAGAGIANSSAVFSSVGSSAVNACMLFSSTSVYLNGSNLGNKVGTFPYAGTGGFTFGFAIDLDNKQFWVRFCPIGNTAAGNWNNSGTANPATNTGGIGISAIAGSAIFPLVSIDSPSDRYVANFGVTPFAGAVPAGFTAGWPTSTAQTTNFTTWNPSDSSSLGIYGGNLTTSTLNTVAGGVRSIAHKPSGKSYFEITALVGGSGAYAVGIGTSTTNLNTAHSTNAVNAALLYHPTSIYINGSSVALLSGGINAGDTIRFAVDISSRLIWFGKAPGTWNSGDPATGTGGLNIAALTGDLYALSVSSGAAFTGGYSIAANFGDSPFVDVVPTGFTAGFPPAAVATGRAKVWSGSAWVQKPAKVWSGSAWVTKPVKIWNGTAWV